MYPECDGSVKLEWNLDEPIGVKRTGTRPNRVAVRAKAATKARVTTTDELRTGMRVGQFVRNRGDKAQPLGVIQEIDGENCVVRHTDIPVEREYLTNVRITDLVRVILEVGSTVWLFIKPFGYLRGTVMAHQDSDKYLVSVRTANGTSEIPVGSELIVARDGSDFVHVVDALSVGMVDHSRSYQARISALRSFISQRAACRGLTAALSANVRPFLHQINVLAQVMSDPMPRYILADEVGLGKTIEAGLIIRQTLIDDPSATVLVAVPSVLVGQWEDELLNKLLLGGVFASRWKVISHDEFESVKRIDSTMLVIDEAHRIAERAIVDPLVARSVEAAFSGVPGLLLLTATPIRGNARVFHYLLHVIDPTAHPIEEFQEFQERLHLREELAISIELLTDREMPWALVKSTLEEFSSTYNSDETLISRIDAALDGEETGDRPAVKEVAAYLRDTYRLSRRVIRNRRDSVLEFPTSGRQFQSLDVNDPTSEILDAFVESWRESELETTPDLRRFAVIVDAALAGPHAVLWVLDGLDGDVLTADQIYAIETLRARVEQAGMNARIDAAVKWTHEQWSKSTERVVVATSYEVVADAFVQKIIGLVGPKSIAMHLERTPTREANNAVVEFVSGGQQRILVIDSSGEEGLNLQAADALLHLDAPLSINRFEQRVGRVDRYVGSGANERRANILIQTSSAWERERTALHHLVGVLDHSVATLQRSLAELEETVVLALLRYGLEGLGTASEGLSDQLDGEREEIDRLEELESFVGQDVFTFEQFEAFEKLEEDWGVLKSAMDRLTGKDYGLNLRKVKVVDQSELFEYTTPGKNQLPSIPSDHLRQLAPLLRGRRTFSSPLAGVHRGVQVVRVGDPLIDWMEDFLRSDERGRTRAVLRHAPGLVVPELWFQFDVLIECGIEMRSSLEVSARDRALRRQGDNFFAPRAVRLWSDGLGSPSEEFATQYLSRTPEGSSGDVQFESMAWASVLSRFGKFSTLTQAAAANAVDRTRRAQWLETLAVQALGRLDDDYDQRERTIRRVGGGGGRRSMADDLEILEEWRGALAEGIKKPKVQVFAAGVYLLVDELPAQ